MFSPVAVVLVAVVVVEVGVLKVILTTASPPGDCVEPLSIPESNKHSWAPSLKSAALQVPTLSHASAHAAAFGTLITVEMYSSLPPAPSLP